MLTLPNPFEAGGRLSLSSTSPTADVSDSTTLYYLPYTSSFITLYNGTRWARYRIPDAGISLNISALSANYNYDIYVAPQSNGGLAMGAVCWTSNYVRNETNTAQNDVLVRTNYLTWKYLGTIRITATAGHCADNGQSGGYRYVWNMFNRIAKPFTQYWGNHHSYSTNTWIEVPGGSYRTRFPFVLGYNDQGMEITISGKAITTASGYYADFGATLINGNYSSITGFMPAITENSAVANWQRLGAIGMATHGNFSIGLNEWVICECGAGGNTQYFNDAQINGVLMM